MPKNKEYDWRSPEARRERFIEDGPYTIRDKDGNIVTDEELDKRPVHPSVRDKKSQE